MIQHTLGRKEETRKMSGVNVERRIFTCACIFLFLFSGCKAPNTSTSNMGDNSSQESVFLPKQALFSPMHKELSVETPVGLLDTSNIEKGYVCLVANNEKRLKLQIIKDGETYTYDLPGDGGEYSFPLNMKNGDYSLRLMENMEANRYAEIYKTSFLVTLENEFQPFLRPSELCKYTKDSDCVKKASELTVGATSDSDAVGRVYEYLVTNIKYDFDKAKTVKNGYLPFPDDTLSSKKGICFDYAALAAAMLRSVGIPTQIITGYVSSDEIYHAWNRIYIENSGWIAYEIKAPANSWSRVDITFAASGTDVDELLNDSLYTTRYIY